VNTPSLFLPAHSSFSRLYIDTDCKSPAPQTCPTSIYLDLLLCGSEPSSATFGCGYEATCIPAASNG